MRSLLVFSVICLSLSGCYNNDSNSGGDDGSEDTPNPEVNFSSFVINLIDNQTSDQASPTEINDQVFVFDDSADTFDDLF